MSQWSKLAVLCCKNVNIQERINELYNRIHFPYKFRSLYSDWIEAQDWSSIDTSSSDGQKIAEELFQQLMKRIDATEEVMKDSKDFDLEKSLDFRGAKDTFRKSFEGNYATFVQILSSCMNEERMLIESSENDNCDLKRKTRSPPVAQAGTEIKNMICNLQQQIGLAENLVQSMSLKQDDFLLMYQSLMDRLTPIDLQLKQPLSEQTRKEFLEKKAILERERDKQIRENFERRTQVADNLIKLSAGLQQLLASVWKEIEKWQDNEKRTITALVTVVEGLVETLEKTCLEVGQLYWQLVHQVEEAIVVFRKLAYTDDKKLDELVQSFEYLQNSCLDIHLQHIFLVDHNIPDRVLRTSSGKSNPFNMSVRILGGKSLGLHCNPPSVKLSVFQEKDIPESCEPISGIFEVTNGSDRPLALNRGTDALIAHFSSIVLKNVKRPDRGKNEELVTELKYAFVFYTSVKIFGRDIKLRAISLPVILTSQTSQEIMAKGTLIWDAAFSEQDRKPFVYRDKVPWAELACVLNALFRQNTGRELTRDHLNYLAKLALKQKKDLDSYDDKVVTLKQVIRDRLPSGKDFSFWKWFWANMNLVKKHVKEEWQDGLIYGFISKDEVRRKMMDCPFGTFLLRFSEANIESSQRSEVSGCLTLAFVEMDPQTGQKKVFHVKEYLSPKDLSEKGLAPILDAMEVADYTKEGAKKRLLRYLWPDQSTTVEARFYKYIKQKEKDSDDYRRGKFNIEIFLTNEQPRAPNASCSETSSCPATPQSSMMSPQYDNSDSTYSAAFVDYNSQASPPQRQTASVRPQGPVYMMDCLQFGPTADFGPTVTLDQRQLQMLMQQQQLIQQQLQQQQQQWNAAGLINGLQNYTFQDTMDQATLFPDLNGIDLQSAADQFLTYDPEGDLVVMDGTSGNTAS